MYAAIASDATATAAADTAVADDAFVVPAPSRVDREQRSVSVAVVGATGRIGRRVLELIARPRPAGDTKWRLAAVVNSRGAITDFDGLDPAGAAERLQHACAAAPTVDDDRGAGARASSLDALRALPRPSIVIDCTASAAVAARYPEWLAAGIDVVTPNKLGPSAGESLARAIATAEATGGARLFDATTVGAQLPLLATLRDLRDAGDEPARVEAVLSGTLSYVLGCVQRGEALSAAVRGAVSQGYAEPHPAADLSGADAARKLVILLRALGVAIELEDIDCVPLVDPNLLDDADASRLLRRLGEADETWRARAAVAEARRECWIYRASFERGVDGTGVHARIAPERVPLDHPLANLAPCENKLILHSRLYAAAPLCVSGPGAGVDLTAAGVYGDLQLAARRHVHGPPAAAALYSSD